MDQQSKRLNPTDIKVVKAKVDAVLNNRTQNAVAQEVFPNQTPGSAAVSMSTTLKKPNVQELLQQEFVRQGITLEAIVKPIKDGLVAEKINEIGDSRPDHSIRLKSSGMAAQFLGIGKQTGDVTVNFISHAAEQRSTYDVE